MSAHTPGPWHYRPSDGSFAPVVQRGAEGGFVVHALTDGRADADARLIAAAPELLAAAHLGLELALGLDGMSRNNAEALADEYAARIRVAIAKAEGR